MISTKILDKRFSSMLEDFNIYCENNNTDINSVFCKAGLYSKRVMGYESMHQGKFAEKILIGLTGATELYTDGKESGSHYGNCDFQYEQGVNVIVDTVTIDNENTFDWTYYKNY